MHGVFKKMKKYSILYYLKYFPSFVNSMNIIPEVFNLSSIFKDNVKFIIGIKLNELLSPRYTKHNSAQQKEK